MTPEKMFTLRGFLREDISAVTSGQHLSPRADKQRSLRIDRDDLVPSTPCSSAGIFLCDFKDILQGWVTIRVFKDFLSVNL